ncbi:MAG: hypothetical protein HOE90_22750 [Bacteriovoracaceae bacterium]|nr:hypothetical protein [Bacteriovoracaceae bacterium]
MFLNSIKSIQFLMLFITTITFLSQSLRASEPASCRELTEATVSAYEDISAVIDGELKQRYEKQQRLLYRLRDQVRDYDISRHLDTLDELNEDGKLVGIDQEVIELLSSGRYHLLSEAFSRQRGEDPNKRESLIEGYGRHSCVDESITRLDYYAARYSVYKSEELEIKLTTGFWNSSKDAIITACLEVEIPVELASLGFEKIKVKTCPSISLGKDHRTGFSYGDTFFPSHNYRDNLSVKKGDDSKLAIIPTAISEELGGIPSKFTQEQFLEMALPERCKPEQVSITPNEEELPGTSLGGE